MNYSWSTRLLEHMSPISYDVGVSCARAMALMACDTITGMKLETLRSTHFVSRANLKFANLRKAPTPEKKLRIEPSTQFDNSMFH